jgi:ketosteroid isomerase-like protein
MDDREALVREVWSRWNAGERELDEDLFDPEFEVHSRLTERVYKGPEEVRRWEAEIDDQFEGWRLEINRVEPLDDDRLLVVGRIRGRGRQSGIDLDQSAAWLVDFRGGRLLRIVNHFGPDAAEQARAQGS